MGITLRKSAAVYVRAPTRSHSHSRSNPHTAASKTKGIPEERVCHVVCKKPSKACDFTVEIVVQLGTGERPTVYTGKLVP